MSKCPQCGKTLKENEVVATLFDESNEPLIIFHVDKQIWSQFQIECKKINLPPHKLLLHLIDITSKLCSQIEMNKNE